MEPPYFKTQIQPKSTRKSTRKYRRYKKNKNEKVKERSPITKKSEFYNNEQNSNKITSNNSLKSIPNYSLLLRLLKPQLTPKSIDYKDLFDEWKEYYKKKYQNLEQEKVAYEQFKKYVDIETFAEDKLPITVGPIYADQDLVEYLTEKYKEFKGLDYDPVKDRIDLIDIFNSCIHFIKTPPQDRFARFLKNSFDRIEFKKKIMDPKSQLCFRLGDRSSKEIDNHTEFVVTTPPPDTDNRIIIFT